MTHLDDGRLLAWIDDDLDSLDEASVREHLDACADCRARRDRLGADARRVRSWLRDADVPAPSADAYDRPWRGRAREAAPVRARPWLRAAAAVAAVAFVVGPAQAWIRQALAPEPPAAVEPPVPAPPAPAQEPPVATTSYRPGSDVVNLHLGPGSDAVRIRFEAADDDRVELWSPWDDIDVTVLPDRIEVQGLGDRAGLVRLRVPAGVRSVTLTTPDGRRAISTNPTALPHTTGPGGWAPPGGR